jgi:hypothetical protein
MLRIKIIYQTCFFCLTFLNLTFCRSTFCRSTDRVTWMKVFDGLRVDRTDPALVGQVRGHVAVGALRQGQIEGITKFASKLEAMFLGQLHM